MPWRRSGSTRCLAASSSIVPDSARNARKQASCVLKRATLLELPILYLHEDSSWKCSSFLHAATTTGSLNGLLVVAVAVVAQAVWGMATTLCPDRPRATMAIVSAIAILLWPIAIVQITIIVLAGLIGWRLLRKTQQEAPISLPITISRRLAISCWIVFFALLLGLPILRQVTQNQSIALFDTFFRVGSLVFGGGHVVLPLLQRE